MQLFDRHARHAQPRVPQLRFIDQRAQPGGDHPHGRKTRRLKVHEQRRGGAAVFACGQIAVEIPLDAPAFEQQPVTIAVDRRLRERVIQTRVNQQHAIERRQLLITADLAGQRGRKRTACRIARHKQFAVDVPAFGAQPRQHTREHRTGVFQPRRIRRFGRQTVFDGNHQRAAGVRQMSADVVIHRHAAGKVTAAVQIDTHRRGTIGRGAVAAHRHHPARCGKLRIVHPRQFHRLGAEFCRHRAERLAQLARCRIQPAMRICRQRLIERPQKPLQPRMNPRVKKRLLRHACTLLAVPVIKITCKYNRVRAALHSARPGKTTRPPAPRCPKHPQRRAARAFCALS